MQKLRKLNLVKTGLKSKFGETRNFFSHELCLYITRFTYAGRVSERKRMQFTTAWRSRCRISDRSRCTVKLLPSLLHFGTGSELKQHQVKWAGLWVDTNLSLEAKHS